MTVSFIIGSKTTSFRQPIMGNRDDISFQRVNRESRGGDLILFRDPQWPKTEVLDLTFDFDSDAEAHRLLYFIREKIGIVMNYRDHENRLWTGVIQNPNTEIVQTGRFTYRIQVLFEGDQVV